MKSWKSEHSWDLPKFLRSVYGQSSHTLAQSNTSHSSFLQKCIEGIISTHYCFHKWSWSRLLVSMVSFVSLRRNGASLAFDEFGRALQVKAVNCKDHTWLTCTIKIIQQRKVMAGPIRVCTGPCEWVWHRLVLVQTFVYNWSTGMPVFANIFLAREDGCRTTSFFLLSLQEHSQLWHHARLKPRRNSEAVQKLWRCGSVPLHSAIRNYQSNLGVCLFSGILSSIPLLPLTLRFSGWSGLSSSRGYDLPSAWQLPCHGCWQLYLPSKSLHKKN